MVNEFLVDHTAEQNEVFNNTIKELRDFKKNSMTMIKAAKRPMDVEHGTPSKKSRSTAEDTFVDTDMLDAPIAQNLLDTWREVSQIRSNPVTKPESKTCSDVSSS